MLSFTAPELCELAGMNPQRFLTLRKRYRKELFDAEVIDEANAFFPVNDEDFTGSWARYSLQDVLSLRIVVTLEAQGLDFKAASRIASEAAKEYVAKPESRPDLWVGRQAYRHLASGEVQQVFTFCAQADFLAPVYMDIRLLSAVGCNVSAVADELLVDIDRRGLTAGWE